MKTASWLVLLAALPCAAGNDKISKDLKYQNQAGEVAVIVHLASDSADQGAQDIVGKGGKLKVKPCPSTSSRSRAARRLRNSRR